MTKAPKSRVNAALRAAQLAWLEALERHADKDATNLARGADIDPSTLTRFKTTPARTLTPLTMRQLASRWQFPLDPAVSGAVDGSAFIAEAVAYRPAESSAIATALAALRGDRQACQPWLVQSRMLEACGFLPGDVVLVDTDATPRDGDAVLALIYDFERMKSDPVWRRLRVSGNIQLLVPASFDPNLGEPSLVNGRDVTIKGVVLGYRLKAVHKAA